MNIIFFSHPDFAGHQSMPRFTKMLASGLEKRGHKTEIWSPKAKLFNLSLPQSLKKWLGYIDQYILFPKTVRKRLRTVSTDTLFVYTDQALGPWVPITTNRHHVIHCHDFLAQRSALGEIPENPTGWTGKQYQAFIRRGYMKGKNFISVSSKTKDDLHRLLPSESVNSKVVYNGLNNTFEPVDVTVSRLLLSKKTGVDLSAGYLLHVGGNQWYKNRLGVIELYDAWRSAYEAKLPLIMIGEKPSLQLSERRNRSDFQDDIYFLSQIDDEYVRIAYSGASLFLFPSLAEGFGWPIAEAMACGCPVITTNAAPMTEVAGKAGFFIERCPTDTGEMKAWAGQSVRVIDQVLRVSANEREQIINAGIQNATRFDTENAIDQIETLYLAILES